MILVPTNPGDRAFAIDGLLDDMAHGRLRADDGREMLAQLRAVGDVGNLERLSRALAGRHPSRASCATAKR